MLIEGIYARLGSVKLCGCNPDPLGKARAVSRETAVKRYVDAKAPKTARALAAVLRKWGERTAAAIAAKYTPPEVAKDDRAGDMPDAQLRRLLDALDGEAISEDLTDELETAMQSAFRRAAAVGMQQVGFRIDADITKQMDAKARDYSQERGGDLIKDLAGTTEDDMRSLLGRAIEEGMSTDELQDAIEGMGAFGEARAMAIARTELAFAHVQGNKTGWRETGQVVGKRAVLGDNHVIEDVCDEAVAAGVVGLDESFTDDADDPPFHTNCVCDIEPVLSDDTTGEDDAQDDGV